jgi:hypothetical protein
VSLQTALKLLWCREADLHRENAKASNEYKEKSLSV